MAWIEQVLREDADGLLREELDKAMDRAGRVWNIVQVMSLNPAVLRDSIQLYIAIMYGQSALSRFQRELIGTVVSAELKCHY